MDFTKLDRVNFAFFQTNSDGYLFGTDSLGDPIALFGPENSSGSTRCSWDKPNIKNCAKREYEKGLIHLVHAANGEIYPSIGGWTLSDAFPPMAANPVSRARFAAQCAEMVEEYDFDGIDIDWEYPGYEDHSGTPADKENFSLLLTEVREKLDEAEGRTGKKYGLTAALPCGPVHIGNIDVPHISGVLDELLLMTYDLHGPWEDATGVNAPLHYQGFGDIRLSVDACVNAWKAEGAPQSKIGIGMPFYGHSFAYSSGLNAPHQGVDKNNWNADDGVPQYYSIIDRFGGMTSVRHDVSKTPYAFFNNGAGLVSYDDERSICEKTEYAINEGLKGFLIWELTGDLMDDLSTPLLDAINNKLANPYSNCADDNSYTYAPSQGCFTSSRPTIKGTDSPTQSPSVAFSAQPSESSCLDKEGRFYWRKNNEGKVVSRTCIWLSETASERQKSKACNMEEGDGDLPLAKEYCPATCGSCPTTAPSMVPTSFPTKTPSVSPSPTSSPSKLPTKAPSAEASCPTGFTGMIAAPVNTCTHYQYCQNGVKNGDPVACPEGTRFREERGYCDFYYAVWCNGKPPEGIPLCPEGYTGLMAAEQCKGYRHCDNGIVSSPQYDCGDGLLFDESLQACNFEDQVKCKSERRYSLRRARK